jgi:hypothetical protein
MGFLPTPSSSLTRVLSWLASSATATGPYWMVLEDVFPAHRGTFFGPFSLTLIGLPASGGFAI